jgi:hypothetical protein
MRYDFALYKESKIKDKRRKLIMESCFNLAVKLGIRHVTIENIMQNIHFEFRTFYNYYSSIDVLLEDIMINAMLTLYDYKNFEFSEESSIYEILVSYGDQFIAHAFKIYDVVVFIDDYDHHFSHGYISNRYTEMINQVLSMPLYKITNTPVLSKAFKDLDDETITENVKMFTSTLFVYISRLIRRESIYSHNVTFLSKKALENLKNALAYAISQNVQATIVSKKNH